MSKLIFSCERKLFVITLVACFLSILVANASADMYWKEYDGHFMPDIDQNQDFLRVNLALDFDDDDEGIETMPGWTSFTIAAYSPGGYGWDNTANIDDRKRASGTALQKDFHFSSQDRTFMVDLLNGSYTVTVYMGDMQYPHDNMDVSAEGVLKLDDVSTTAGQVKELSFSVTVLDGTLDLLFHDDGGTDPNWAVNGIKIISDVASHYCAPVAEANSLWWLDKRWEHIEIFEFPYDGLGYIGGDVNGDGIPDILDFVQELAWYKDTNGQRTGIPHTGTTVVDEQAGIDEFLHDYGLDDKLYEETKWDFEFPDWMSFFYDLEEEVERCEDVKLDLGFWHVDHVEGAPGDWMVWWSRRGGHAVTVAGVDSDNFLFAVSDPDNDAAEAGMSPGVVRPGPHGYPHPPTIHNNEMFASHDIYWVGPSPSPGGKIGLQNFPWKWNFPTHEWEYIGPVHSTWPEPLEPSMTFTEIEAAVIVSPLPYCGNGVIDPGETCDPPGLPGPNPLQPGICRAAPPPSCTYCGDSIVNDGEACDDGDGNNNNACNNNCQWNPDITVVPSIINFGNQPVSSASAPQTVTVSNAGSGNLVIGAITITGTNANQFIKQNDNCSGQNIPPAGSCTVQVVFKPTSAGAKSAILRIPSNDPDENPVDVPLNGTGVEPDISVSPSSIDFKQVLVNGSSTQTLTISNTGGATLSILTMSITGTHASMFSKLNDTCSGQNIAPSGSCTVDVKFSPTSTGKKTATLSINSNDPDENPVNVPLKGKGAKVVLTSPNGGETLIKGSTHSITWQTSSIVGPVSRVVLKYTINGGASWTTITNNYPNLGTYPWSVPNVSSSNCKVKVILKNTAGLTLGNDVSDGPFTIQ